MHFFKCFKICTSKSVCLSGSADAAVPSLSAASALADQLRYLWVHSSMKLCSLSMQSPFMNMRRGSALFEKSLISSLVFLVISFRLFAKHYDNMDISQQSNAPPGP